VGLDLDLGFLASVLVSSVLASGRFPLDALLHLPVPPERPKIQSQMSTRVFSVMGARQNLSAVLGLSAPFVLITTFVKLVKRKGCILQSTP